MTTFGPEDAVLEQTTSRYRCTLQDADGVALNIGSVTAIAATLTDAGGNVINDREAQSVLNANGGTLASGAVFTLVLSAADLTLQAGEVAELITRRLTLDVEYTSGELHHQVEFYIRNLSAVG
jgi:hypothetical protein